MRNRATFVTVAAGVATVIAVSAWGFGIPAKFKASAISGSLVPAFSPSDTGSGTGDDEGDDPAFLDTAVARGTCSFLTGKFKLQVGKDASVQLSGVDCGGGPFTGTLCAHTKVLSTVVTEEFDKSGGSTPVTCDAGPGGDIAGKMNFTTGNIGTIACASGKCKGTLATVTTDPCPAVDKIAEVHRVEVFDGPLLADVPVLGTSLKSCCGPRQILAGAAEADDVAPCTGSPQDVFAAMGTAQHGAN